MDLNISIIPTDEKKLKCIKKMEKCGKNKIPQMITMKWKNMEVRFNSDDELLPENHYIYIRWLYT